MNFANTYASLPEHFYARLPPAEVPAPRLLAWNNELAAHLGLGSLGEDAERLAGIFGGNEPLPGGEPIATAYAGHQFGHFVPQLGDGRALLLGEAVSPVDGRGYDIQLKGSGQTPFSRRGDGKSSLGPVIREYLVSEAMHRMGVPTTRALAAVATGEKVYRENLEPGGVLTRVASSHLRVGTFQYFASRGDEAGVRRLMEYAIGRHYPQVADADQPALAFFAQVVEAQAHLIAHWMALGFIHGVMNTDNCAISGETLDYGPCAFMDEFHVDKVFSSIDQHGRYAYSQQSTIAQWNLARLAECLMMLGDPQAGFERELLRFEGIFEARYYALMAEKLGFSTSEEGDRALVTAWLQHLQDLSLDYSQSFTRLADRLDRAEGEGFGDFEIQWRQRIERQPEGIEAAKARMRQANPVYIPRNHHVERAIQAAFREDFSVFDEFRRVLERPFERREGFSLYEQPPQAHERVEMTFCGT